MKTWSHCLLSTSMIAGCVLLAGCWSSSPIEERNLEAGIALDAVSQQTETSAEETDQPPPKKQIRRTVQFILPEAESSLGSSSQGNKFYNEEELGVSIMEMTRESYLSNQSPAGFHLKTIVISSELLQEVPMQELLDFYLADNDIRLSILLVISTGTASDVFKEMVSGKTPAFMLKDLFDNRSHNSSLVKPVSLAKVIGPLKSKSSFVLPNVITIKQGIKLSGAGVIRGKTQKYAGYLNETDVEGLQWIKGDLTGGVVKGTDSRSHRDFVYEIKSAKSDIKARVHKNEVSFHVTISSVGRLSESFGLDKKKMDRQVLVGEAAIIEDRIKDLAQHTISKMKKMQVEVANFGQALRIQHPGLWEQLKDNWDQAFTSVPVTFEVKVHIEDSGASTMTVN
ncbi:Ger(x)C family spore germination protein [Paenibacillus amylolyticus]|uniref:Ger(x)C family spore germination protein n=1 Tax=Paenibacillus amylolyticus TaxID=1451 RepID=UPI0032424056